MFIEKPDYENLFFQRPKESVGELFYENTKLHRLNSRPYGIHIGIVTSVAYFIQQIIHAYKCYPHAKKISLITQIEQNISASSTHYFLEQVKACMYQRRSIRHFSVEPLGLNEVGLLLQYGCGITKEYSSPDLLGGQTVRFRAIPSAGGLFPLEVYVIALNVRELDAGVYHYNVKENALEFLKQCDVKQLTDQCREIFALMGIANPAVILSITGIFRRNTFKYMDRGYRFTFLEAGHLGQNVHLLATALGLGCVELGGYLDDEVNALLGIDGVEEGIVNAITLGKPSDCITTTGTPTL